MSSAPKKKSSPVTIIIVILVLAAIVGLGAYSLRQYNAEDAESGIMVCNEAGTECTLSLHIHADVAFNLCGQEIILPRETGALDGLHTHKEPNYLHFHDNIHLDPVTKVHLPDKRLSLQEIMDVFQLSSQKYCETSDIDIIAKVNGQVPAEGLGYNWKDGDDIELVYQKK